MSFAVLQAGVWFCFGLVFSNFGSLAMEPLGRVAGTASSVQGCVTTVGGAPIGFLVGQSFDGTAVPMSVGFVVCGLLALGVVLVAERGRLFGAGRARPAPRPPPRIEPARHAAPQHGGHAAARLPLTGRS